MNITTGPWEEKEAPNGKKYRMRAILYDGLPGDFYLGNGEHISIDKDHTCWYSLINGSHVKEIYDTYEVKEKIKKFGAKTWEGEEIKV